MNASYTSSQSPFAIAWAAGFIDGEGCIQISKTQARDREHPTYRPRLDVSQNDREVLVRLREILNENSGIYMHKRQAGQTRQPYVLVFDGWHALRAVSKIRPFLIRKDEEADLLLSYPQVARMGAPRGPKKGYSAEVWEARESIYRTLQELKAGRTDKGALAEPTDEQ